MPRKKKSVDGAPSPQRKKKEKATAIRGFCPELGNQGVGLFGMLVFVDGLAHAVLALVETLLLSLGQVTVVSRHVSFLLVLNALFALFQMRSLFWRELASLGAIRDALLLIGFAAIDLIDARMTRIDLSRTSLWLSRGGANKHQTTYCQN